MKIVFLNFQTVRTDNFNLAKSSRNTCKGVCVFTKHSFKANFENIPHALHEKPYLPSPGISWKTQKEEVNIIFP